MSTVVLPAPSALNRGVVLALVDALHEVGDRTDAVTQAAVATGVPVDTIWAWALDTIGARRDLLGSRNIPASLLDTVLLGRDEELAFRAAENPRCSPTALTKVARTHRRRPDGRILAAAANPTMPPGELARLAAHGDRFIRLAVAKNPSAAAATLRLIAGDPGDTREAVAAHPNCPGDVLEVLADSASSWVRVAVGSNHATPRDVLLTLRDDPIGVVSDVATATLAARPA